MAESRTDIRIAALGDSFVQGVGDSMRLGWLGRLASMPIASADLTVYNLGIRRNTSDDIVRRWREEATSRLVDGDAYGLCLSFGVNDTTAKAEGTRVPEKQSVANFRTVLQGAQELGWSSLVLGPPPIADAEQNTRINRLDRAFGDAASDVEVPYVSTYESLITSKVWMTQVAQGDGAHPGIEGYDELTRVAKPAWDRWVRILVAETTAS